MIASNRGPAASKFPGIVSHSATSRQPAAPRAVVYGFCRKGGIISFMELTAANNEYPSFSFSFSSSLSFWFSLSFSLSLSSSLSLTFSLR